MSFDQWNKAMKTKTMIGLVFFLLCANLHAEVPYINVKVATSTCAAAMGDNTTDDTAAIQCHIDSLAVTGGRVYFPAGRYVVSGAGISVWRGIWLVGDNLWTTSIRVLTDATVLRFANSPSSGGKCPGGNHYGGLSHIAVDGHQGVPTKPATIIGNQCNVTISDASLLYGTYGLDNRGVDSRIERSMIWGFTGGMISSGANWYRNVKFNQPGSTAAFYAVYMISPIPELSTVAENHFTDSDFSGSYNYSVYISDGTSTHYVTVFQGTVFSSPVVVANAKATMFSGIEFGHTTLYVNSGYVNVVASYAFTPLTMTGAGVRSCAGNARITC